MGSGLLRTKRLIADCKIVIRSGGWRRPRPRLECGKRRQRVTSCPSCPPTGDPRPGYGGPAFGRGHRRGSNSPAKRSGRLQMAGASYSNGWTFECIRITGLTKFAGAYLACRDEGWRDGWPKAAAAADAADGACSAAALEAEEEQCDQPRQQACMYGRLVPGIHAVASPVAATPPAPAERRAIATAVGVIEREGVGLAVSPGARRRAARRLAASAASAPESD